MRTAYLIPKPDYIVRDPLTLMPLPAQGASVPMTPYWIRRCNAGDVTERRSQPKTPKPAAKGGNKE